MRSEDRKAALDWAALVILWLLGDELDDEGVADLRDQWSTRLIPAQNPDVIDEMWAQILEQRRAIIAAT